MSRAAAMAPLGAQFDAFLHATLGEDSNGLQVSVLSALAQRDIDPWQHAAYLTRLSKPAAIREFAAFLETLPAGVAPEPGSNLTAAVLIDLLQPPKSALSFSRIPGVAILVGYLAFVLLTQWLIARLDAPLVAEPARAFVAGATAARSDP